MSTYGNYLIDSGHYDPREEEPVLCPACQGWRDDCRLCKGEGVVTEQGARDYGHD